MYQKTLVKHLKACLFTNPFFPLTLNLMICSASFFFSLSLSLFQSLLFLLCFHFHCYFYFYFYFRSLSFSIVSNSETTRITYFHMGKILIVHSCTTLNNRYHPYESWINIDTLFTQRIQLEFYLVKNQKKKELTYNYNNNRQLVRILGAFILYLY